MVSNRGPLEKGVAGVEGFFAETAYAPGPGISACCALRLSSENKDSRAAGEGTALPGVAVFRELTASVDLFVS